MAERSECEVNVVIQWELQSDLTPSTPLAANEKPTMLRLKQHAVAEESHNTFLRAFTHKYSLCRRFFSSVARLGV